MIVVPLLVLHAQQQVVAGNSCIVHQDRRRAFVRLDVVRARFDRRRPCRDVQHDAAPLQPLRRNAA